MLASILDLLALFFVPQYEGRFYSGEDFAPLEPPLGELK